MEKRHTLTALGLIVAAIIAANTPACNPSMEFAPVSTQAKQICDDVYAHGEDRSGYGDCIRTATSRLQKY